MKKKQIFLTHKILSCGQCKSCKNPHKRSIVESSIQESHPESAPKTCNKRLETLPFGVNRWLAMLVKLHTETLDTEVDTKNFEK